MTQINKNQPIQYKLQLLRGILFLQDIFKKEYLSTKFYEDLKTEVFHGNSNIGHTWIVKQMKGN